MNEEEIRVIKLFKALSNPTRYKIVKTLAEKEMKTSDICKLIRKNKSATLQHLRILKNLDIVQYYMSGKNVIYKLKKGKIFNFIIDIENYYLRNKTV